jgi:Cdc6-like AAA superfamily ATPase
MLGFGNADNRSEDGGGSAYQEAIEEMDRELTKVIEDFDRAVNVEALRRTKETGEHSLSQSLDSSFSTVSCRAGAFAWSPQMCQDRLSPGSPLYGRHPQIPPQQIIAWVTNGSEQTDGRNTYWIYGLPGIGKTSLAHSICASLHDQSSLLERFSAGGMTRN